jgi:putative transcriptional regulator
MGVKELRKLTGLSQTAFGEKYDIPMRTIQNWENGVRVPPNYILKLLERVVKEDFDIK